MRADRQNRFGGWPRFGVAGVAMAGMVLVGLGTAPSNAEVDDAELAGFQQEEEGFGEDEGFSEDEGLGQQDDFGEGGGAVFGEDEDDGDREIDANLSFELRLESAEIVMVNLDDDEREFVRYTFAERIDRVLDESQFALIGLDPSNVEFAETVFRDEDDRRSVLAGFEEGTDVFTFPLAAVGNNAVIDIESETNVRDTALLAGVTVDVRGGRTSAPDLVNVRRQPNLERVEFVFDENVDEEFEGDVRDFGFFTRTGEVARGDAIVSVEDEIVTVFFDERSGDQVEEGERFFTLEGAVVDDQGDENPLNAIGAETTVPDLVDVDMVDVGSTQFEFVFDEEISNAEQERFFVYTSSGIRLTAEAITRPDGMRVRAAFPQIEDFGDEVVIGAVLPGAVTGEGPGAEFNTVGSVPLGAEDIGGGGPTIGPDLTGADILDDTGEVQFTFDESIDDDEQYEPSDFLLITESGSLVTARDIAESDQDFVIAVFDENDLEGAVAVTLRTGAVQDFLGNPNPLATMAL